MAPLKQKSHCETKMSEWDQGLYSTADRAQWAGRARVTEGQLWPKGHRSFCVTRMGLSGGSLYISTCVHPSEPGPGPVPTGTQSRPLAAARLVETHAGLGDGGVLGRRRRGRRRGWAPPGVSQGGLHEGGGFEWPERGSAANTAHTSEGNRTAELALGSVSPAPPRTKCMCTKEL
uniref:Uncharacterized protein n=1 Tax=Mustela putorius furo TaxID=9669 RepID=M3XWN8_MUSPF